MDYGGDHLGRRNVIIGRAWKNKYFYNVGIEKEDFCDITIKRLKNKYFYNVGTEKEFFFQCYYWTPEKLNIFTMFVLKESGGAYLF